MKLENPAEMGLEKQELTLYPHECAFSQLAVSFNGMYEAIKAEYGTIPEEVDSFVIEKLGMRLYLVAPTLIEMNLRFRLIQSGQIDNPFAYIPYIGVESEENMEHITEEEHRQSMKRLEIFMDKEPEEMGVVLQYGKEYLNL